jgi:hypothetical protein
MTSHCCASVGNHSISRAHSYSVTFPLTPRGFQEEPDHASLEHGRSLLRISIEPVVVGHECPAALVSQDAEQFGNRDRVRGSEQLALGSPHGRRARRSPRALERCRARYCGRPEASRRQQRSGWRTSQASFEPIASCTPRSVAGGCHLAASRADPCRSAARASAAVGIPLPLAIGAPNDLCGSSTTERRLPSGHHLVISMSRSTSLKLGSMTR